MKVGIIGIGFVGNAIQKSFEQKSISLRLYDKYKNIGSFEEVIETDMVFLALPTLVSEKGKFDTIEIINICNLLKDKNYSGIIILKSTVETGVTNMLANTYPSLIFIHNPEFLTARTAEYDFHNQNHIVIGKSEKCSDESLKLISDFYKEHYPDAELSLCTSNESESMKIFCNSFYAVKVQFFNELYDLCKKTNINYDIIKDLMLKNNWINPIHTNVPGPDGQLSYGGACLPKDSQALLTYMKENSSMCEILNACVSERNSIRKDN